MWHRIGHSDGEVLAEILLALIAEDRDDRLQLGIGFFEPLRGDQVVVVGDTPFDIRCGRAIEAKVLAVATGGSPLDELRRHQPDWVVGTLEEISARQVVG